jgi:NIPSNAP
MIYLEETFNLVPASPETMDTFVDFAQEKLVPRYQQLGARLVAAWYSDVEAFAQVMQVLEFDSLAALGAFRAKASEDEAWMECEKRIEELAPVRHSRLMEALGPVPPEALGKAAAESQKSPLGAYSLARLEVSPGMMPQFIAALEGSAKALPIVASWRTIVGKQNEVTDVWKSALRQSGYQPAEEGMKQFFRGLRELAPRERLIVAYPLPYSPLR